MYQIYNADCVDVLREHVFFCDMIFADPPDNLGLGYSEYDDCIRPEQYDALLYKWLVTFLDCAPTVWLSFSAKYVIRMGVICHSLKAESLLTAVKPCVQTYTFYQHNQHDLGNAHRPLWRFQAPGTPLYPDQVRIPSWRQLNGDRRADARGKVPGDVFEFPRVTGNSSQRRAWCPTQLHEDLVARCIQLCTKPGDLVFDPFAGSGTTLRVCKKLGRHCITCDVDPYYCEMIAREHGLEVKTLPRHATA